MSNNEAGESDMQGEVSGAHEGFSVHLTVTKVLRLRVKIPPMVRLGGNLEMCCRKP